MIREMQIGDIVPEWVWAPAGDTLRGTAPWAVPVEWLGHNIGTCQCADCYAYRARQVDRS